MPVIHKLRAHHVIDHAAEELKKYLRMMMPECGEIAKRGLMLHDVGHGQTCRPFGLPANNNATNDYSELAITEEQKSVPEHITKLPKGLILD